jgi:type IV pilus assembly protein PilB
MSRHARPEPQDLEPVYAIAGSVALAVTTEDEYENDTYLPAQDEDRLPYLTPVAGRHSAEEPEPESEPVSEPDPESEPAPESRSSAPASAPHALVDHPQRTRIPGRHATEHLEPESITPANVSPAFAAKTKDLDMSHFSSRHSKATQEPETTEHSNAPVPLAIKTEDGRVNGVGMVDFRSVTPEPAAVELLDESAARSLHALPIAILGETVQVAVDDTTPESLQRIREAIGQQIVALKASNADLTRAISNSYSALAGVSSRIHEFEVRDSLRREAARLEEVTASDDAPVVQVVQMLIAQGFRDRASDIHIEPHDERVRVRYRVDGALHDEVSLPGSMGPAVVSRLKILSGMNIVERRRPQDGQISMQVEERDVDIRVSTTAVVGGEKVVMRLLDKSRPMYELGQLGMPDDTAARYRALLHSPYGMVICAGPTGSGKTTSLYASLGELNAPERNIMTIEDPVEYTFASINQIQINEAAGVTFANGLRSILRQDPDVILVGEVRDVDTARIAVQSALTGHFVLSSLHATDSISALHRLLDMGIEPFLVASSVTAVMAQRLVRRNCIYCSEPYQPSAEELAFLHSFGVDTSAVSFIHGVGCNFCSHTGFLERIGVYELMVVTDRVRELVLDHGSHDDLRALARSEGMRNLPEESILLALDGITTPAEVMRSIYVLGG